MAIVCVSCVVSVSTERTRYTSSAPASRRSSSALTLMDARSCVPAMRFPLPSTMAPLRQKSSGMPARFLILLFLLLILTGGSALAAQNSLLGLSFPSGPATKSASIPMQIVLLLTGLTRLPAIVMCLPPFLRTTLVLHFLRQALATQTVPSNQILVGLSLFLTLVIMNPVLREIYATAWQPLEAGKLTFEQAADQGSKPLKRFLLRFARDKDLQLFTELSHSPRPANANEVSLSVLV